MFQRIYSLFFITFVVAVVMAFGCKSGVLGVEGLSPGGEDSTTTEPPPSGPGIDITTGDKEPPVVEFVRPENDATNVPINISIVAKFNEELNQSTVHRDNFIVRDQNGIIAGELNYNNRTIEFLPAELLNPSTSYNIKIAGGENGIADVADNVLAADYSWSFMTGERIDVDRPTVSSVVPEDGATDVPINQVIEVTFSKDMREVSINQDSIYLSDDASDYHGEVTYDVGSRKATFAISGFLMRDHLYKINVAGSVTDTNGIPMGEDFSSTFQTGSRAARDVPPLIEKTIPADGTNDVSVDSSIEVYFSREMDETTLGDDSFAIEGNNDSIRRCIVTYRDTTEGDHIARCTPTKLFSNNTLYTVRLSETILADNGRELSGDREFSFTTEEDDSARPHSPLVPEVIKKLPRVSQTGVGLTTAVIVHFNVPMMEGSIRGDTFQLLDENRQLIEADYDYVEDVENELYKATLTPRHDLEYNSSYRVFLSERIRSRTGDRLRDIVTWIFETKRDTTAPRVTGSDPAPNATDVPINKRIIVKLSEELDPESVTRDSISLYVIEDDGSVSPTVGGGRVIPNISKIIYESDRSFQYGTTYKIVVSEEIKDLAGNSLNPRSVNEWTFKTVDEISVNPVIEYPAIVEEELVPRPGAENVSVTTDVEVFFTKDMDQSSIETEGHLKMVVYGSNEVIPGDVYLISPRHARWKLDQDRLSYSTTYQFIVSGSVKDREGNMVSGSYPDQAGGNYSWTFTTEELTADLPSDFGYIVTGGDWGNRIGEFRYSDQVHVAPEDNTPPEVIEINPPSEATEISLTSEIYVIFSEPMDPASVTSERFRLLYIEDGVQREVEGTSVESVDGSRKFQIRLGSSLEANTDYYISLHRDVKDLAGNILERGYFQKFTTISDEGSGQGADSTIPSVGSYEPESTVPIPSGPVTADEFITPGIGEDNSPPEIEEVRPLPGSVNIQTSPIIYVVFNKEMDPTSIIDTDNLELFEINDATNQATKVESVLVRASDNNTKFRIHTTSSLRYDTSYWIYLHGSAHDTVGNTLPWNNWELIGRFTTRVSDDSEAPTIVHRIPSNGSAGVTLNAPMAFVFSEPMRPESVEGNIKLYRTEEGSNNFFLVTSRVIPEENDRRFHIDMQGELLRANTKYVMTVTNSVEDKAGNKLDGSGERVEFTTGDE